MQPYLLRAKSLAEQLKQHRILRKSERLINLMSCPYCNNKLTQRNGKRKDGTQTFLCPKCRKAFSERTGTCFHHVKFLPKMKQSAVLMSQGYFTLRQMADLLGINIMTAFEWRHKILSANDLEVKLDNHIGAQSIQLSFSRKGLRKTAPISQNPVQVLLLTDEKGNTDIDLCNVGKFNWKHVPQRLIQKILSAKSIYAPSLMKEHTKLFEPIQNAQYAKPSEMSIQIHLTHGSSGFQQWIEERMRGVATKYLEAYANWYRLVMKQQNDVKSRMTFLENARSAWGKYTSREKLFYDFLRCTSAENYIRALARNWKTSNLLSQITT